MNLAALWKLPVLFVCENNLYAMGTALARSESVTDIALKASAYGVPAEAVDGMDVIAAGAAAARAAASARAGFPYLLEFRTYRFRAHSMFDPELYRTKSEVEDWKKRDPIQLLISKMRQDSGVSDSDIDAIEKEVAAEIDDSVAFADSAAVEPVADLTRFVYSERRKGE
jgi:TPP-dependent pyruvate/acetoin dehydrogenase alpha subunit